MAPFAVVRRISFPSGLFRPGEPAIPRTWVPLGMPAKLTQQPTPAAKPEAHAEGNRVAAPRTSLPRLAARASRAKTWVPLDTPARPDQHPPALKPEAQAEGIHVGAPGTPIPRLAPRASRAGTWAPPNTPAILIPPPPPAAKPEAHAEGIRVAAPRTPFPRLAPQGTRTWFPSTHRFAATATPSPGCRRRTARSQPAGRHRAAWRWP